VLAAGGLLILLLARALGGPKTSPIVKSLS
jgi:hypothetical protein